MQKIDLKQVMVILRSGEWIKSIRCITADVASKTGGKIIDYKNCRIARRKTMLENETPVTSAAGGHTDARHNYNFTINLEMKNSQIRKIHPTLIFEINGQQVL